MRTFDDRGNVAMIAAVAIVPLTMFVGVAVSLEAASMNRAEVQNAADFAALAMARELNETNKSDGVLKAEAWGVFLANVSAGSQGLACSQGDFDAAIDRSAGSVSITATCTSKSMLGGLVGQDEVALNVASTGAFMTGSTDVVFMFDVSGSMGDTIGASSDTKIEMLIGAANTAMDILLPDGQPHKIRVGYVTYSTGVNAYGYFNQMTGLGTYPADDSCITAREPDDTTIPDNERPSASAGYLQWVDQSHSNWGSCPDEPSIQPLTNNKTALKTGIGAFSAGGWTNGPTGIAVTWYLLSSQWGGGSVWPVASTPLEAGGSGARRIAVLMTDGKFNKPHNGGSESAAAAAALDRAELLCDAMKADGVTVYTIGFDVAAGSEADTIMTHCASAPVTQHKKSASDQAALVAVYQEIAEDVLVSHLRLVN